MGSNPVICSEFFLSIIGLKKEHRARLVFIPTKPLSRTVVIDYKVLNSHIITYKNMKVSTLVINSVLKIIRTKID